MDRVPQLEQLLSEYDDATLTQAQRQRVADAAAQDAAVTAELASYEKLNRLLAGWRRLPQSVDWEAVQARIGERVRAVDEEAVQQAPRGVDDLVAGALGGMPEVDWQAFKNRVSTAVHNEAARMERDALLDQRGLPKQTRLPRSLVWATRVGVPLAAAAAIAFAFLLPSENLPNRPRAGRGEALVFVSLEDPTASGTISISFDETPPTGLAADSDEPGGVAMTIVPRAAMARASAEADEAYFY